MSSKVVGVILSGGRSARMGSPKALLVDSRGQTLLQAGILALRAAGIREVLVVTGFHPAAIAREAVRFRAVAVHNRSFDRGQWSSVRVGLRAALRRGATRVVIGPVDVPAASPETLRALGRARAELAVPCFRGASGHPISVAAPLVRRLLADRRSAHLREALEASGSAALEIEVGDVQIVVELNTPPQYRRWVSWSSPSPGRRSRSA